MCERGNCVLAVFLVSASTGCGGGTAEAPRTQVTSVSTTAQDKARQTKQVRQSSYVASLLVQVGDYGPHLGTNNLTRAAVEAAMGVPDHVWQGDAWGHRSKDTVYLYYLVPDAGATASLRDTTVNGKRKQYRFVFYGHGNSDSPNLDELRIYSNDGYGGQQITKYMAIERSHLLW